VKELVFTASHCKKTKSYIPTNYNNLVVSNWSNLLIILKIFVQFSLA